MAPFYKLWLSKLALAFKKPPEKENSPVLLTPDDQSFYDQLSFSDTRPPTTGSVQLGVPLQQYGCLFFNLPGEIRQTIYKYVFGPSLIHVASLGRRLAHVRCEKWKFDDIWDGHHHWEGGPRLELGAVRVNNSNDPNDQLISLCLTCRRM